MNVISKNEYMNLLYELAEVLGKYNAKLAFRNSNSRGIEPVDMRVYISNKNTAVWEGLIVKAKHGDVTPKLLREEFNKRLMGVEK